MIAGDAIGCTSTLVVTGSHTARAMGSGDMDVLATPALVALMENAAMLAASQLLEPGQTTVGASIQLEHLRPSPVGAHIKATATLKHSDGRRLTFDITAWQGDAVVGQATHTRCVVDRQRFLGRLH